MRFQRYACVFLLSLPLIGCNSGPPSKDELREIIVDNFIADKERGKASVIEDYDCKEQEDGVWQCLTNVRVVGTIIKGRELGWQMNFKVYKHEDGYWDYIDGSKTSSSIPQEE